MSSEPSAWGDDVEQRLSTSARARRLQEQRDRLRRDFGAELVDHVITARELADVRAQLAAGQADLADARADVARLADQLERTSLAARRVPRMETVLRYAEEALEASPQECRFHGTEVSMQHGRFGSDSLPELGCESCRVPFLVRVALDNVRAELGTLHRPGGERRG